MNANPTANAFQFRPATKEAAKLRAALFGPSGSGKTFSALRIATGLGGPIAVIDTERGSASKYADRFAFDTLELEDKTIPAYEAAIRAAAQAAYPVLIIDSLSHAWQELLQEIDRLASTKYRGNTWSAWSEGTPKQRRLVDAILSYPGHLLATMRSKTEWAQESTASGKVKPVRVGLAPEQGKGVEYEFDLLLELSHDHIANVIKDRSGRFQDQLLDKPGEQFGTELAAWLSDAPAPEPKLSLVGPQAAPADPHTPAAGPSGHAPRVTPTDRPRGERGASNSGAAADKGGESVRFITKAKHRRLEKLLKEADLPRERVREWLAHRHPQVYPDGVHLDRIWATHAEEIEHNIPRFRKRIEEERSAVERGREARERRQMEALDWAADECGWKGDLNHLADIAEDLAERAGNAHRAAQMREGRLDQQEVAAAERLSEQARLLREHIADTRERQDASESAPAEDT